MKDMCIVNTRDKTRNKTKPNQTKQKIIIIIENVEYGRVHPHKTNEIRELNVEPKKR